MTREELIAWCEARARITSTLDWKDNYRAIAALLRAARDAAAMREEIARLKPMADEFLKLARETGAIT